MPKNKSKNYNTFVKYLIAVLIGLICFAAINIILALITVRTPYPKENTLLYALASIIISSFISSFFYCFRERKNGLVSGLIIGAIMCVILFLIYACFSYFNLNDSSLLIIPSCIVPSSSAGIIAVNLKRR